MVKQLRLRACKGIVEMGIMVHKEISDNRPS